MKGVTAECCDEDQSMLFSSYMGIPPLDLTQHQRARVAVAFVLFLRDVMTAFMYTSMNAKPLGDNT